MSSAFPLYLTVIFATFITAPFSILVSRPVSRIQWQYVGSAFLVFCVSCFFLILPFAFPAIQIGHLGWWTGKVLSIVATYSIIFSLDRASPARSFMTLRQKSGSGSRSAVLVLLLLLLSALNAFWNSDGGRPSLSGELLLFEATLPGIDEEAVFRAAFLGYLLAVSRQRGCHSPWNTVGAVITNATLFGLMHAMNVDAAMHFHFNLSAFAFTGVVGAGLALLTLNSGSILLPVIAHNLTNLVGILL
jgi:hypothetical protein